VTVYSDQIDENLSLTPAQAYVYVQTDGLSEVLNVSQLMDVIKALNLEIDETLTITDAAGVFYAIEMLETIAIDQAETVNSKFNMTVAEQAGFRADLISAWPVELVEALQITAAQVTQTAITVMEALQLEDDLVPALMYHMTLSERLVVADALVKFLGADLTENLTITPAMSGDAYKAARVDETLSVADALTPQLIFRLTCSEELELTADEAVKMIFNAEIDETIEIAGAYLAPNGSVTTWVMNTKTGGVTEYQNYAFNSFARVGNKYLGAADDGLYELLGDSDEGADIIATIRSGFAQWSGTHLGSFKAAYLAVAGAGDYILRVLTRDGKTFNYKVTAADGRTVKVNMGKGLRSRYFAFELVSAGQDFDLDTLEFVPLVADRRV
jgi:hypothetical protein